MMLQCQSRASVHKCPPGVNVFYSGDGNGPSIGNAGCGTDGCGHVLSSNLSQAMQKVSSWRL